MSRPDLFDEIIECLKMQALDSPDTCLSPEVRREFYADVAKPAPPPAHSRRTMSPGCAPQRFSAPPRRSPADSAPHVCSAAPDSAPPAGGKDPRNMSWRELAAAVASCRGCKLCRTRTNTVFGDGNVRAELMFLGEAPGADEDLQGLPFVGRAGELLTRMIGAMQFNRAEVFIANTVKCRPPNNRNPEPDETEACRPFIMRQIELIRPKVIVMLGAVPLRLLFPEVRAGITRIRGSWMDYHGIKVMPTFHPAYLLRNPAAKADVWKDLQLVMAVFGKKHVPGRRA